VEIIHALRGEEPEENLGITTPQSSSDPASKEEEGEDGSFAEDDAGHRREFDPLRGGEANGEEEEDEEEA